MRLDTSATNAAGAVAARLLLASCAHCRAAWMARHFDRASVLRRALRLQAGVQAAGGLGNGCKGIGKNLAPSAQQTRSSSMRKAWMEAVDAPQPQPAGIRKVEMHSVG